MRASGHHKLTEVDTSGRISLGRARAGTLYDVSYEADGRVVLTPMEAVPKREAWLYRNPEAMSLVDRGLAEMTHGETEPIDLSVFPQDED